MQHFLKQIKVHNIYSNIDLWGTFLILFITPTHVLSSFIFNHNRTSFTVKDDLAKAWFKHAILFLAYCILS